LKAPDKGGILAEALPYLRAFHQKTIVVRFGASHGKSRRLCDAVSWVNLHPSALPLGGS